MNIGTVPIPARVALAPMAGVTDLAFRAVCREQTAMLTVTEMVSAKALCYGDQKSFRLMALGADEHPVSVQLFGHDPACLAEAACIVAERVRPDLIDLNMGCPTPKIVTGGDGCALMKNLPLARDCIEAVARAVSLPVTVKFRRGWDKGDCPTVAFAQMAQSAGAAAVCVHGRTKTQMYAGQSDRDCIRAVKAAVTVPVIANGDAVTPEAAVRLLAYTGADMVMIGRGAFGNPWIFSQTQALLEGRDAPPLPPLAIRLETALRQIRLAAGDKGEHVACLEARRHLGWYLRGVPHAAYYKQCAVAVSTLADVEEVVRGAARDLSPHM